MSIMYASKPSTCTWLVLVLSLGLAAPTQGQATGGSPTAVSVRPITWRPTTPLPSALASVNDVWTLNRYLSYGSVIGVLGGLAWGAITDHRQTRALDIAGDAAIGWVTGMAGGALAYVVHQARHH